MDRYLINYIDCFNCMHTTKDSYTHKEMIDMLDILSNFKSILVVNVNKITE
ncbi:MAG TPA: hypothetical protein VI911_09130 [Patescibacteria group bacterium]|nr:MAG: hypothetical protein UR43_C0005G0006 [candidate division TM6 bacterium GW2011_GWF2_33_332]HLD91161.1 hypothetical protein [Patescibacteria group bacterium]